MVKIKETLDHHLEIYDERECIAKHPVLTGKATTHIRMEHYDGLHTKEKGQKAKNVEDLATDGLHSHTPSPNVESDSYRLREKKKAGIYPAQTTI